MYYEDDFCYELSEFNLQIEKFKQTLWDAVKNESKEKIAALEKEVEELREFRDEKNKVIARYDSEITNIKYQAEVVKREAKEAEEKWKKARLYQLLGDYLVIGWKIGNTYELGEKCDKCDDDRRIHFTSPRGKEYTEECRCAIRSYFYFPEEAELLRFFVKKRNFKWDDNGETNYYYRYYNVKKDNESDEYTSTAEVYTSANIDFTEVNEYRALFLNKDDCQRYCDWKNATEKEKTHND